MALQPARGSVLYEVLEKLGEGEASRRGVVLPLDAVARARSRFRLPIGGELPNNRARTTALSALSKREGPSGSENGRYANRNTVLMFPIVRERS